MLLTRMRHINPWRRHFSGDARCLVLLLTVFVLSGCASLPSEKIVLRIYDWKTQRVYVEAPARVNSRFFFGWIHSQEKIPWNEYYHIDERLRLVLDTITFPAFGAGIPEDKGRVTYVKNGLIHMDEIGQPFTELVWLNSHAATRELVLDEVCLTRGSELPEHTRLRLVVERSRMEDTNDLNKTGR